MKTEIVSVIEQNLADHPGVICFIVDRPLCFAYKVYEYSKKGETDLKEIHVGL